MSNIAGSAALCALAISVLASAVQAQETTGDLVSMNAKKLGKDDLSSLLGGAMIEYVSARGIKYHYEQKADGSLYGHASGFQNFNGFSEGKGNWRVSEGGEYCIDSVWGHSAPYNNKWCGVVYQAGNRYFLTYPGHPEAKPLKLSIEKS